MPTSHSTTSLRGLTWLAAGLLGTALLAIGLTLWWLRTETTDHALRDTSNLATVLSEQMDRSIQSIDLMFNEIQRDVKDRGATTEVALRSLMKGKDTYDLLTERLTHLSQATIMALIDNRGRIVVSTSRWPLPPTDVSDREYFRHLKSIDDGMIYVSDRFVARLKGVATVFFGKRLNDTDHHFLGLILIGVKLSYFQNIYESIKSLNNLSFLFLRKDGSVILRYPDDTHGITKMPAQSPWYDLVAQGGGTYRSPGYFDKQARLVAVRPLDDYPLVIDVAISEAAALATWRDNAILITVGGLLLLLCIVLLFTRLVTQLHGLAVSQSNLVKKKQELEHANAKADADLNNMSQGLAMFDAEGRLVICNQNYLDMYSLSPDAVRPGCTLRELLELRMRTGSFSCDDLDQYIAELQTALKSGNTPKKITKLQDGRIISIINRSTADGGWVATHEDVTEIKLAEARITHVANHDALTGLANRSLFAEILEQALKRVRRGEQLAVLYLDLDHLKRVNDTLGHPIGDKLLKQVADRLRGSVRDIDLVARLSGDEFAVIQTSLEDPSDAAALAMRMREAIHAPYNLDGHQVVVDISVGIAIAPSDAREFNELLKAADIALYEAKNTGRGTYCFYEAEMNARMQARGALEHDLRSALLNGEFEMFYQPIVSLQDNSIRTFEALLRWRHPKRGMIPPAEFIPVAEEMGLITALGEWVLRTACAEASTWPSNIKVAINLSSIQLSHARLVDSVVNTLASTHLPASRLELEITESAFLENSLANYSILKRLHELGVRFSLDDFGIGYSSLGYMLNFPFSKIKVDQSFIANLSDDDHSRAIVRAISNLAHDLNMSVVVEGVETEQQLEQVKILGCTEMQGFLFSRPRPSAEIQQFFPASGIKAGCAA